MPHFVKNQCRERRKGKETITALKGVSGTGSPISRAYHLRNVSGTDSRKSEGDRRSGLDRRAEINGLPKDGVADKRKRRWQGRRKNKNTGWPRL